ncbi:MAG: ABC transporter permease [Clostridiales bacterium]|nr:ABC transporter permease [Clostridiales bacterium]MDY5643227.1 ABC transporter permease [Candidatus Faecousia sp.]
MDKTRVKRLLAAFFLIYWIFVVGIYLIANEQFRYSARESYAPAASYPVGEIVDGMEITQDLTVDSEGLTGVSVLFATYGRENSGTLEVSLEKADGTVLLQETLDAAKISDNVYQTISFDQRTAMEAGEVLTLRLRSDGCAAGNAVTVYAGNADQEGMPKYSINGEADVGTLCVKLNGYTCLGLYKVYWVMAAAAFVILAVYALHCWRGAEKGKSNLLTLVYSLIYQYGFLMKQLVIREFKTKYKRSVLGMAWSFLNPLLTMAVQYAVFSSIFRSGTPNYPTYLLTGVLFFNFLSEAVSQGMTSIVANASLIKKVYVPKYIYPFSKTVSSLINFAIALLPLAIVMLLTKAPITPALLLMFYVIVCFMLFVTGFTLMMSVAMTFFQDTQFLWGIVSMLWMYLTPIFYTESIIPQALLPIYRLNPMYRYITFARTCIIDGVAPSPAMFFFCLVYGLLFFFLGLYVFKRHQDKFVLYL